MAKHTIGNWQHELDTLLEKTENTDVLDSFYKLKSDADRIKFIFDNGLLS